MKLAVWAGEGPKPEKKYLLITEEGKELDVFSIVCGATLVLFCVLDEYVHTNHDPTPETVLLSGRHYEFASSLLFGFLVLSSLF